MGESECGKDERGQRLNERGRNHDPLAIVAVDDVSGDEHQ